MDTMHADTLVNSSFEACAEFGPVTDGSPVCACGWLDSEHERPGAEVHSLPVRAVPSATPKRLAS